LLPRFRWRSLSTRIIAWSFVPTTIILVAVALGTFYAYQRVTEDLVVGRNREVTRLAAGQLAADLGEFADVLAAVARTADIQGNDPVAQRAALSRAKNRLVVFDAGVVILDNYGRVQAAEPERPEVIGQDWSNRAYFRQMLRSAGTVLSDILPDGPDGADVVLIAVPITGSQGEFRGTMAGLFRLGSSALSSFYASIVKLRIGEDGVAYLVDSSGRLIYHSDHDLIGQNVAANPSVQQVLARKVGDLRTRDASGAEIAASFAPVAGTPWGLVTEEDWATLMASSQGYRNVLLLLLALGVVVPAIVVTVGARRITGSIAELTQAAREVAGGRFGRSISVTTGDELEQLAAQFNIMSAQLQQSYAELERRVADRTRELATLNAIAGAVSRSLELDDILNDALDETLAVMHLEIGVACRLEEGGRFLALMVHRGISDTFVRHAAHLPVEEGLASQLREGAQAVMTRRTNEYDEPVRHLLEAEGIEVVVSVPLTAKGRLLGTINLGMRSQRSLSQEELSLLAAIGQQVGVAMENARLYEQAEATAAMAERSRLARDLHDAVSQTLFSASLIAEVLPRLWERNPEEGRRRLAELRQLTRGALAEMRTLLLELRPAALREAALGDLMRQLGEAVTGRARLPVALIVDGQRPLPPDVQIALYRIAQEALNNVAKHSGAGEAAVELRFRPEQVELRVRDDGRGFDQASVPPDHLGLGIMRERAAAIGASLAITSRPGEGTEIEVVWRDDAPANAGAPAAE